MPDAKREPLTNQAHEQILASIKRDVLYVAQQLAIGKAEVESASKSSDSENITALTIISNGDRIIWDIEISTRRIQSMRYADRVELKREWSIRIGDQWQC